MNAPRSNIPEAVRTAQNQASDPRRSVFVAANAGSGKTHVLVNRVIRLLLEGVAPEKILCITFTKAAAANMAQRVFEKLGHWITMSDDELDAAIGEIGVARSDATMRRRARELFARALETPGGLKVQTIHALCTRLLQQFPFEANVPAHFAVMDDRDQGEMMERANLAVLLEAAATPSSQTGRALQIAMSSAADVTFQQVVREACLSRDTMAWSDRAGDPEDAAAKISRALGFDRSETLDAIERDIVNGPMLPLPKWKETAAAFDRGTENDQRQAARLRAAHSLQHRSQVDAYLGVFLTDSNAPRKSLVTAGLARNNAALAALMEREKDRVLALVEKRRAALVLERTAALFEIANAVSRNYRTEKQARGLLDYDDLIDKTLAMLRSISAEWVHFKLDRGVDHVLIDEAQDTSPRQWDIIAHMIAEFTTGAGARDGVDRTVFAVGDEKQSIFSFQGAAPREFDARRRDFAGRFAAANRAFANVSFNYSFRSGTGILRTVESTFQEQRIYKSVTTDEDGLPPHMALDDAAPSVVELWELEKPDNKPPLEGWRAAFDATSETSPEVRLARRVQAEIKALLANGIMTGSGERRRPLQFGDILVLVRRRGKAFDSVIQALKQGGVPVAGADRLKLTEHIAVIDLMNLADALLFARDDLALAVALKSPLFGLDDDDLLTIAPGRQGSLREALAAYERDNERLGQALHRLKACEARAASTPFGFYTWLLGADGSRARILKRLGTEANDALDEFLELAWRYEQHEPASLQGFMAWLRAAETEVKRDMDIVRDEVRVMTVHGAKGLEAAVVFLIDTTTSPTDTPRLNLIRLPRAGAAQAPPVVVWAGRKADDPAAVAAARTAMLEEAEDEYRRLLYVAMTRAADRLIVTGCLPGNRKTVRDASWYDLVDKGLAAAGLASDEVMTSHGLVKRFSQTAASPGRTGEKAPPPISQEPSPPWLRVVASPQPASNMVLRPSEDVDDFERGMAENRETPIARNKAMQRGTLAHRLLQSLPDLPAARRQAATDQFLARNADDWSLPERDALSAQVLGVMSDPRFAAVFGDGSRAEVSLAGRLRRPGRSPARVSGQIDRLVVTPTNVLIVDYKTTHAPPRHPDEAPRGYIRQLALYRGLLAQLYPKHAIGCALLWTEVPELMEIPSAALDRELAAIISP